MTSERRFIADPLAGFFLPAILPHQLSAEFKTTEMTGKKIVGCPCP
jgi:hypothetical protein